MRYRIPRASPVALVVKNLSANARDIRDSGSIFGSGRSPRRHGNPLQHSCLEIPWAEGKVLYEKRFDPLCLTCDLTIPKE